MDNVCAECAHETDNGNGPCVKCGSMRIVNIKTIEELFGDTWREAFEEPKK